MLTEAERRRRHVPEQAKIGANVVNDELWCANLWSKVKIRPLKDSEYYVISDQPLLISLSILPQHPSRLNERGRTRYEVGNSFTTPDICVRLFHSL